MSARFDIVAKFKRSVSREKTSNQFSRSPGALCATERAPVWSAYSRANGFMNREFSYEVFTHDELLSEEWRAIPGLEGCFEVSSLGAVRRIAHVRLSAKGWHRHLSEKTMRQYVNGQYFKVSVPLDHGLVHRLVAHAFIPNPLSLPWINHLDGQKLNNRVANLEWCSTSRNQQHAYDTGLKPKLFGQANGRCKLTLEQVEEIKLLRGTMTHRELAARFGISKSQLGHIFYGFSWNHLNAA